MASLIATQNERIGRALQRLSHELYSCDSHCVLELIQNADDNAYAPGVVPALRFRVDATPHARMAVLNNEAGFQERHVRALCDVGRSTKSKLTGYIGQKGIGFKSVFRISDAPQIHSAGARPPCLLPFPYTRGGAGRAWCACSEARVVLFGGCGGSCASQQPWDLL